MPWKAVCVRVYLKTGSRRVREERSVRYGRGEGVRKLGMRNERKERWTGPTAAPF